MNEVIFSSENNEYKIRLTKQKKFFTQSQFGQYNCTIEFYNTINLLVLKINCTEKELYLCIQKLSELGTNIMVVGDTEGIELSSVIEFNSTGDLNNYFWYLSTTNITTFPMDYPTDDDIMCSICIFSNKMDQNSLRIFLPMTYSFPDVMIYNIYLVLEDIPYLDELNNQVIKEFIEGEL